MELDPSNSVGYISCLRPRKMSCCWGSRWRSIPRSCCAVPTLQHCKHRNSFCDERQSKEAVTLGAACSFNTHLLPFKASFPNTLENLAIISGLCEISERGSMPRKPLFRLFALMTPSMSTNQAQLRPQQCSTASHW